jgi:ribosomal protein S18 acetylase RimI-like enzyme
MAMASFAHDALEGIVARPIEPGDLDFLQGLYASTRADEMAATGWPPAQCRQFLDRQFDLQHRYYQAHHAGADFLLLLRGVKPIGRLYWREFDDRASLIDVSVVPEERGHGIGSALMRLLMQRADQRGLVIELHVEPHNPALRLYRRFGFELGADNGVYARMRREPGVFTVVSSEGCIA